MSLNIHNMCRDTGMYVLLNKYVFQLFLPYVYMYVYIIFSGLRKASRVHVMFVSARFLARRFDDFDVCVVGDSEP